MDEGFAQGTSGEHHRMNWWQQEWTEFKEEKRNVTYFNWFILELLGVFSSMASDVQEGEQASNWEWRKRINLSSSET